MQFPVILLLGIGVYGVIQAHAYCTSQCYEKNIAPSGVASQSSLFGGFGPALAIDGNANSNFNKGSCAHTNNDAGSWWRVDLLRPWKIKSVVYVNQATCCPNRLLGAEIRIGNSPDNNNPVCGTISESDIQLGSITWMHCHGMEGRYVTVIIPNRKEYLTVCELEVYPVLQDQSSGIVGK
ncbi:fucolectin-1-like [Rhinatrema bivittatum]|uniref:fucolectin-1-like n=1 Tax=Rhinatrema bivittatum TaxID=194408 RepID=UPI0011264B70|nr:fucolectin-1-like [Rhinatrema bivittatum]